MKSLLTVVPTRFMMVMQMLLWCLLGVVLVRTAWICDDAYITMRCVDNAVHGFGFTYNPLERVQAYTHPLWALLLLPLHAIFRNAYWEMLILGMGFSLAALWVVGRSWQYKWAWLALPLIAIASKAFIEYSTSGLENALTYFLLALFVREWWQSQTERANLFRMSLLSALILLTRMDLLLMVAPALGLAIWQERSWHALRMVVLGFLPFLAWEVFSVIYYGFPFPNTAYAKLGTLIPPATLLEMGKGYFADSLRRDAVTLTVILSGIGLGFLYRRQWPLMLGVLFYLVYVLRIGGDFMSGRFLAAPFLVALMAIGHILEGSWWRWALLAVSLSLLGLLQPTPMLLSGSDYKVSDQELVGPSGVADERAFYYGGTGMLHAFAGRTMPDHPWALEGSFMGKSPWAEIRIRKVIGMTGYFAGPYQHFIDPFALSDPLLARIPAVYKPQPRAGHFYRRIPIGYKESVGPDSIKIVDPVVREMYDQLRKITRGPLFSWSRFAAIWEANLRPTKPADLHAYLMPLDVQIQVQRETPINFRIWDGNSTWFKIPSGVTTIHFRVGTEVGCDMIWLHGDEPQGGFPIDGLRNYDFEIPADVDGVAFVREGHLTYCAIENLQLK